jgi:formylglycine-generating enzyme required for sulfatase activity/GTPase SAR1 family protein
MDVKVFDAKKTLDQYKNEVCNNFSKIRLLQFVEEVESEKEIVDVEDIYVDLMCEPFSASNNTLYTSGKASNCSQTLILPEDEIDRRNKLNMVILGLPGAGKTTLLKYLLKKYSEQAKVVPIYIELKSEVETEFSEVLAKEGKVITSNIYTYIKNYFIRRIGETGEELAEEITRNLFTLKYELVFFCDGLDEISPTQYKQFTAVVNKASTFVGYHFIISSRQIGFYASNYNEKFKLFCLLDFDERAQLEFIEKYYKKLGKTEMDLQKAQLVLIIKDRSDMILLKLAKSPILLSLLCVTPNLKNIRNKAQLFQNAIDVLLSNRKITRLEDRQLFIDFLKELAVIFFKLDKAECFDNKELEFYADRFFCSQGNTDSCLLLKEKYLSCGLFDKSERTNSFKFAHRTIWEYLVAVGMFERDYNEIYNRANMGVWEEPIKMFVSLVGQSRATDATTVIEKIWNENKALALNCMNEFDPFPIDILNNLYGNLSRREKLSLVSTLRNSYINYNGSFRNPVINTIKETLTLIHSIEMDCEVIYSYLEFLNEYNTERAFADLLRDFLKLDTLKDRQDLLKEYGLEFVDVHAGAFNMGRHENNDHLDEKQRSKFIIVDVYEMPEHPVKINQSFKISKTLITNRMYFDCGFPYADYDHMPNPYSNAPNQPVNFVNWYQAMVFAKWFGYTLPSEAEWEFACRGGEGNNDFMSDKIEELETLLNKKVNYTGDRTNKTRIVLPINNDFANSLGLIDMIGNLREWCIDWFSEDYYTKCIVESYSTFQDDIIDKDEVSYYWSDNDKPVLISDKTKNANLDIFTFDKNGYCIDPVKNTIGKLEAKSLRGGCFDWSIANLRPTYRNHNPANNIYKVNGFRVVLKEDVN